eukprot:1569922-Prymnesium_polylepis.1
MIVCVRAGRAAPLVRRPSRPATANGSLRHSSSSGAPISVGESEPRHHVWLIGRWASARQSSKYYAPSPRKRPANLLSSPTSVAVSVQRDCLRVVLSEAGDAARWRERAAAGPVAPNRCGRLTEDRGDQPRAEAGSAVASVGSTPVAQSQTFRRARLRDALVSIRPRLNDNCLAQLRRVCQEPDLNEAPILSLGKGQATGVQRMRNAQIDHGPDPCARAVFARAQAQSHIGHLARKHCEEVPLEECTARRLCQKIRREAARVQEIRPHADDPCHKPGSRE